jgi:hypothetical protein
VHQHIKSTVGTDPFPESLGRAEAPVYGGRMTAPKLYIRGWEHRFEPLLVLNDVSITPNSDWASMLLQLLESPARRTVRWDLKSRQQLGPEDAREIVRYWQQRGLLNEALRELRDDEDDAPAGANGSGRFSLPDSLFAADGFRRAYEHDEEDPHPLVSGADPRLHLPSSYETGTTLVIVANDFGGPAWSPVFSRLRVFVWDPSVDELIAHMLTWTTQVPRAIISVIDGCHRRGEVLSLDYRAVCRAAESFRSGMPWEDDLRASFSPAPEYQVQDDARDLLDWLVGASAKVGDIVTERDLYQAVASLRGEKKRARRESALGHLKQLGYIERLSARRIPRAGSQGRPRGPSIQVLDLPGD